MVVLSDLWSAAWKVMFFSRPKSWNLLWCLLPIFLSGDFDSESGMISTRH